MTDPKRTYTLDDLPVDVPIFPLSGTLLLPGGELPLNIFEPRYLAMVEAALGTPLRLIGLIQPRGQIPDDVRETEPHDLFTIGCAGRINSFHETDDGRYLITLAGLCRFKLTHELPQKNGFRRAEVRFQDFAHDLTLPTNPVMDRTRLLALLKEYFHAEGLSCNWEQVKNARDDTLITALSMICPFRENEKQALLEAIDPPARAHVFMTLLELAVLEDRARDGDHPFQVH